jgi:hypothetical protein
MKSISSITAFYRVTRAQANLAINQAAACKAFRTSVVLVGLRCRSLTRPSALAVDWQLLCRVRISITGFIDNLTNGAAGHPRRHARHESELCLSHVR